MSSGKEEEVRLHSRTGLKEGPARQAKNTPEVAFFNEFLLVWMKAVWFLRSSPSSTTIPALPPFLRLSITSCKNRTEVAGVL